MVHEAAVEQMGAGELLLRADEISYSQGKRLILDRVSFELRRAQITTIIGPNGAGKSTLTNVVNGLISNYSGSIERSPTLRIGYLPQKVYVNTLMPLSVERLLRLTRQSTAEEIDQALAQSEVAYLRQRQVRPCRCCLVWYAGEDLTWNADTPHYASMSGMLLLIQWLSVIQQQPGCQSMLPPQCSVFIMELLKMSAQSKI